jgi:alpha-galactosidase
MAKVAIIGAGSIVFCKTLILDILATEGLEDTEFALMAPSTRRTPQVEAFVNKVIKANDLPAKVWVTTDRREAVKNADYVIATFQVGGITGFEHDYKIPLSYGVDQCIGDTLGPGGVFRALRSIPVIMDLARDMEELCPNATLLNYVNPMAMICWALGKTNVPFVGLCHGVQTTMDLISGYVGVPKDEIDFLCAGINHMGWFLKLAHNGKDLYPLLRQKFEQPAYYVNEKVRGEVFRHFGYFMTESTGHLSEYVPWFRKNKAALDMYCDEPSFGGESGAYYNWCKAIAEKYAKHDPLEFESSKIEKRSVEYCSYIIEAVATGKPFRFMGNVRNDGYITNLPPGCCVEVPTFADDNGLHPTVIGDLPSQCAAACMTNINVQILASEAALDADTEKIVHALAMDPLTSAVCTLKQARDMAAEMLEAQRKWLPQFKGKKIAPKPTITIPKDCKPVDVPLDPALAIGKRFGTLIEQKTD